MRTIEIRTYRLNPGVSAQFEAAMQNALPMVRAAMDVVAFGRTDHEGQTYFLIRAYSSQADLKLKHDSSCQRLTPFHERKGKSNGIRHQENSEGLHAGF
jgi:hypothetical protein